MATPSVVGGDCSASIPTAATSLLCGSPAIVNSSKILLSSEVKNKMTKEKTMKTFEIANDSLSKVIMANRSDLEVSVACSKVLENSDQCVNVADALGRDFTSISVKCLASGRFKQQEEWVKEEKPQKKKRTLLRCTECSHIDRSMHSLIRHQRERHLKRPEERPAPKPKISKLTKSNCNACSSSHILGKYSCKNCAFVSTCPFALEKHMKNIHDSQQIYHCPCCQHQHRFYTAMERHLFEKHAHEIEKGDDDTSQNAAAPPVVPAVAPVIPLRPDPNNPAKPLLIPGPITFHQPPITMNSIIINNNGTIMSAPVNSVAVPTATSSAVGTVMSSLVAGGQMFDGSRILTIPPNLQVQASVNNTTTTSSTATVAFTQQQTTTSDASATMSELKRMIGRKDNDGPSSCNSTDNVFDESLRRLGRSARPVALPDEPYFCQFCGGRFRYLLDLKKHFDLHNISKTPVHPHGPSKYPVYSCFICMDGESTAHFQTLSHFRQHFYISHRSLHPLLMSLTTNKDPTRKGDSHSQAMAKVQSWETLALDVKTYRDVIREGIQIKVFRKKRLTEHLRTVKPVVNDLLNLTCKICSIGPLAKPGMAAHLAVHTQRWPFSCPGCSQWFKQKPAALEHAKNCSRNSSEVTSRVVIKMEDLRAQNEQIVSLLFDHCDLVVGGNVIHTFPGSIPDFSAFYSITEFWCDVCKHNCMDQEEMRQHMHDHVDVMPYQCNGCSLKLPSHKMAVSHVQRAKCTGGVLLDKLLEKVAQQKAAEKLESSVTMVEFRLPQANKPPKAADPSPEQARAVNEVERVSTVNQNGHLQTTVPQLQNRCRCSMCDETFDNYSAFKLHAIAHFNIKPWWCKNCHINFKQYTGPGGYQEHALNVHTPQQAALYKSVDTSLFDKQEAEILRIYRDAGAPDEPSKESTPVENGDHKSSDPLLVLPALPVPVEALDPIRPVLPNPARVDKRKQSFITKLEEADDEVDIAKRRRTTGKRMKSHIQKMSVATYQCPDCQDFEGVWNDVQLHYEAMHYHNVAVCPWCTGSMETGAKPLCFQIGDYYQHMSTIHKHDKILEHSDRLADRSVLAREFVERLGGAARDQYGILPATELVKCSLITVKMSGGNDPTSLATRYACRKCSFSSRSSANFFTHVAGHLDLKEFHCLHCSHVDSMDGLRSHYRFHHHMTTPDHLPHSVQYKLYKALMDRVTKSIENIHEKLSETTPEKSNLVKVKEEPRREGYGDNDTGNGCDLSIVKKEPGSRRRESSNQTDTEASVHGWYHVFSCPYCEYETSKSHESKQHVEMTHARKQLAVNIDLNIYLFATDAETLMAKRMVSKASRDSESDTNNDGISAKVTSSLYTQMPERFKLETIATNDFLNMYNERMMSLYNNFSILETLDVTGGTMVCHVCTVEQNSFPALFEHWNRQHMRIEPYSCAFCSATGQRATTIISHERRNHPQVCGSHYGIDYDAMEEQFANLHDFLDDWLKLHKLDSYIPDDLKLILTPCVRLRDISKDVMYRDIFRNASPTSSVDLRATQSGD